MPLALELANLHLSMANPVEQAVRVGLHHLNQCYVLALSPAGPDFDGDALKKHSIDFDLQYVALETHFGGQCFQIWGSGHSAAPGGLLHRRPCIYFVC